MKCKFCRAICRKAGRQINGRQRYYCKGCKKYQQSDYQNAAYKPGVVSMIPKLVKEKRKHPGHRRILQLSLVTVIKKIKAIAATIQKPPVPCTGMFLNVFPVDGDFFCPFTSLFIFL